VFKQSEADGIIVIEGATGSGLINNVKVLAAPLQPLADGVTVKTSLIGAPVVFVAMNELILPVPLFARPMDEFAFDQL
jgi:hypothetical protein